MTMKYYSSSLFSAYASFCATYTLLQQAFYQFVPVAVRNYLYNLFWRWFGGTSEPPPDIFTLIIPERDDMNRNELFAACHIYLCRKMNDSANCLQVSRASNEDTVSFKLVKGVKFLDTFEGVSLNWTLNCTSSKEDDGGAPNDHHKARMTKRPGPYPLLESMFFSLSFDKKHKKKICDSFLPFVISTSQDITREGRVLRLFDCTGLDGRYHNGMGKSNKSVKMTHPFTFEKLAIDPRMKKMIMDDLDRFVKRRDFYRRVGKPWKRGYLLYGPPGTGKSSLIAAMANHLRFDIYDLQLGSMFGNYSSLRDLLLWLPSRSIVVIEDIDRTRGLPKFRTKIPLESCNHDSHDDNENEKHKDQNELASLLNFVDGLWSCCGDERIIVLTTNHKEKLDPALLRPGRMDMHILMSFLTMPGFMILAYNYLEISDGHAMFPEIERLLKMVNATPAEVAEELMRSEDADIALQGVVEMLKGKVSKAEVAAPAPHNA